MDHFDSYLQRITPTPGDPTFSLLKSHLVMEEVLRNYLEKNLSHPSALKGARLTFSQILAVARATSEHISPDHWIWKAIGDLNKLRNLLAHNSADSDLRVKIDEYVKFVIHSLGTPMPPPAEVNSSGVNASDIHVKPLYIAFDMATIGLYACVQALFGLLPQGIERPAE